MTGLRVEWGQVLRATSPAMGRCKCALLLGGRLGDLDVKKWFCCVWEAEGGGMLHHKQCCAGGGAAVGALVQQLCVRCCAPVFDIMLRPALCHVGLVADHGSSGQASVQGWRLFYPCVSGGGLVSRAQAHLRVAVH